MKMIARRKNRKENGARAEFFGSNPHSNGEVFSRSWDERELKSQAAAKVKKDRAEAEISAVDNKIMVAWKY